MMYTARPRQVTAFHFNGRNGLDAIAWAELPGGKLTYRSSQHLLHYHELVSPTKWGPAEIISPNHWLVKDATEFYALTSAQFEARFAEVEGSDKRQGKLLVETVPTTEKDDIFSQGFAEPKVRKVRKRKPKAASISD